MYWPGVLSSNLYIYSYAKLLGRGRDDSIVQGIRCSKQLPHYINGRVLSNKFMQKPRHNLTSWLFPSDYPFLFRIIMSDLRLHGLKHCVLSLSHNPADLSQTYMYIFLKPSSWEATSQAPSANSVNECVLPALCSLCNSMQDIYIWVCVPETFLTTINPNKIYLNIIQ